MNNEYIIDIIIIFYFIYNNETKLCKNRISKFHYPTSTFSYFYLFFLNKDI